MLKAHSIEQIEKLQEANMYAERWRNIVDDGYSENVCSITNVTSIKNKATYLVLVLYNVLEDNFNSYFTSAIEKAMKTVNNTHLIDFLPKSKQCKSNFIVCETRRIYDWICSYQLNHAFTNPAKLSNKKEAKLPPILHSNPELLKSMLAFCCENINSLSVEALHQFLLTKALLPDSSRSLFPKDKGYEIILSAFTSCEVGFGLTINKGTLDKINEKRKGEK